MAYAKRERMKLGLLGILLHFLMVVTTISCGLDPLVMIGKLIWHDVLFSMVFCAWIGSYLIVMTCMVCAIENRWPHVVSLTLLVIVISFATMTASDDVNLMSVLSDKIVFGATLLCWIGNPWIIWFDFMS
jgi:hypothetical protein